MSIVCLFVSVLLLYVGKLLTRANVHVYSTDVKLLVEQQRTNGIICLASTVIDRRQWLAEHRQKPTCLGHLF